VRSCGHFCTGGSQPARPAHCTPNPPAAREGCEQCRTAARLMQSKRGEGNPYPQRKAGALRYLDRVRRGRFCDLAARRRRSTRPGRRPPARRVLNVRGHCMGQGVCTIRGCARSLTVPGVGELRLWWRARRRHHRLRSRGVRLSKVMRRPEGKLYTRPLRTPITVAGTVGNRRRD